MDLADFNAATPEGAAAVVRPCADVDAWVDGLVEGRPYDSVADLLARAEAGSEQWSTAEIDQALAQHPRIGERAQGDGAEARMSGAEQAGVTGIDEALAAGNRAYEERFGRIFLIRARGRSGAEVLDQLTQRLGNAPEAETAVVAGQLREIALLRLEGTFAP